MDANKLLDGLKAVSLLFTETDLIDLHQHQYPSLRKLATHQYDSHAIKLVTGSSGCCSPLTHLDAPIWQPSFYQK